MKYFRKLGFKESVCPTGCSGQIGEAGSTTTLIGWFGGPDKNPNHWKSSCTCENCGFKFIKHWVLKDQSTWYTQDGKVIAGESTCCEGLYDRSCDCGGWMSHSSRKSIVNSESNIGGRLIPNTPRFWQCLSCNKRFPDHYYGDKFIDEECLDQYRKWSEKNPVPPPPPIKFLVKENIDVGIINLNSIAKLNKNL